MTTAAGPGRGSALGHEVVAVLPAWITARILVGVGYVMAVAVSNRLVAEHPEQLRNGLVAWDGTFYRDIATSGYRALPIGAVRFFPLFPLLGRVLAVPVGGRTGPMLVVLANVFSLVALVLIRRLVLVEKADPVLADRAVWCLALFPAAFVLAFGYSEALMLVLTIGVFLGLRRERWWLVAALGFGAALCRPLGVVVALPVAVAAMEGWRTHRPLDWLARVAAVGAPFVGLATYLAWVGHVFGNWRLPFTVQDDLRGGLRFPVSRIIEGVHQLTGSERFGDGLHLPFLLVLLGLLVVVFRRWPLRYGLYAGAILLLALSAENLNSIERYGLNAFPLVLGLAVLTRPPQVDRAVMAVLGGGVVALSAMAWLGAYVP